MLAGLGWHRSPRVGVEMDAGAILGGSIDGARIEPGFAASVAVTWLPLYETERRPFVVLGASAAASHAPGLTAIDVRAAALVGKTFGPVSPYLVARGFGGPVWWSGADFIGTDEHHFAVGAGLTLRLPANVDVLAEIAPLGERSLTIGAGVMF